MILIAINRAHCAIAVKFLFYFLFPTIISAQPAAFLPKTKLVFHRLGNNVIPIQIIQYGQPNGIVCLNLHDDEFTSVTAAKSVLKRKGGTLIKIQNKKERLISFRLNKETYVFDPNRMFARAGIAASLKKTELEASPAIDAIEKFANQLLHLIPHFTTCLIALHNNTPGYYSIDSYLPGGHFEKDAKDVIRIPQEDPDDIFFSTDENIFREMADAGYNSILQDNENARKDGSLSVHFGELKRSYVNIETEHGKVKQYREMMEALLKILGKH